MRHKIVVAILLILYLMAGFVNASDRFQSVSGDNARSYLDSILAENPKPAEEEDGGLWGWGSAPKGSMVVDGELVPVPDDDGTRELNTTANWLGELFIDPYTGAPVYDNRPTVYDPDSIPIYGIADTPGTIVYSNLPPVFSTNNPWA